jgi:nitroreductase
MNEVIKNILNRRSTRAYKAEQITDEELNSIIQAGQFAPSAINQQPWHFSVVQNKELLRKISSACKESILQSGNKIFEEKAKDENFSIFYNAPTLIIILGDPKAVAPQIDCSLALENMFLAAESLNIGSCWINAVLTLINSEAGKDLRASLEIPTGYSAFAAGAFGYKATDAAPAPRKENTISILK